MLEYQINLKKSAEKELERLPDKIHDRIVCNGSRQNIKNRTRK